MQGLIDYGKDICLYPKGTGKKPLKILKERNNMIKGVCVTLAIVGRVNMWSHM